MHTTELIRREGFWYHAEFHKLLPKPAPHKNPWTGQRQFLMALAGIEASADASTSKGQSNCRVCWCKNGSITYQLAGWMWPNGFRHYVEVHNVRPSLAFQEFVLGHRVEN